MFRLGQKVVCVDDSKNSAGNESGLREGSVYTVKAVLPFQATDDDYGVELYEMAAPHSPYHLHAFRASRFRPVIEGQADISIFRDMLEPSREPVAA
ncbi:hypothetical protein BH10PSE10_BH10PSE10_03870 [soil metagenome]